MNFKNYQELKKIWVLDQMDIGNFKLTKLNSVMVYTSFEMFKEALDYGVVSQFKKVYVEIGLGVDDMDGLVNELLCSNQEYPDNVQFVLYFETLHLHHLAEKNISSKLRFKIIDITGNGIDRSKKDLILQNFLKLNLKSLIYYPNLGADPIENPNWFHSNLSTIFQHSTALKEIKVSLDYFEPRDLLSINCKSTRLKSIWFQMNFNHMVELINDGPNDQLNQNFRYPGTLRQDWNEMIKVLMNIGSLENLYLNNYCFLHNRFGVEYSASQSSCLTQGFKSLLSNPKCSIKTLEISSLFNLVDDLFLEGLCNNTSISTLILVKRQLLPFCDKVFRKNRTIRHLLYHSISEEILFDFFNFIKKEFKAGNIIDLYSVTIIQTFVDKLTLDELVNEIKSNSFSIKEYNIYIESNKSSIKNQTILINNSILNILVNV